MHHKTYDLESFDNKEIADAAGYTIPVPAEDVNLVQSMNRKQRRAWVAEQRRIQKRKNNEK